MTEPKQVFTEDLLDDYPTSRVPEHRTVGGIRIGLINGALAFAVPGLVTGFELGGALGLQRSLYAFLIGGLLLAVMGTVTGIIGASCRLTSYMLIKFIFGNNGAKFVNITFALALFGWFGVNVDLFSGAAELAIRNYFGNSPPIWVLEIGAGILITASTVLGFRLINRLSAVFVPILFLVTVYLLYRGLEMGANDQAVALYDSSMTLGQGISAVVGSFSPTSSIQPHFKLFSSCTVR